MSDLTNIQNSSFVLSERTTFRVSVNSERNSCNRKDLRLNHIRVKTELLHNDYRHQGFYLDTITVKQY